MARPKRSNAGRALAGLGPPSEEMLLGRDVMRITRALDAGLKRGRTSPREIGPLLERLATSEGPSPMHTRGGGSPWHASTVADLDSPSLFQLLNGLYLPVEALPEWIPSDRRYVHDQVWPGGEGGSASAYKGNGKLTAIQMAMVNDYRASTYAGVYILVKTSAALPGRVTQLTFNPEIDWMGRDFFDADFVWRSRIDGTVEFSNRIWVVVYELNPVSGQYEPLASTSAVAHNVSRSTWYVTSSGMTAHAGSLRNGAAAFRFIASPGRTYLMGVLTQMSVAHNLRNVDGGPVPPPKSGDLVAYALSKVDVPAMWVDHQVLSP